MKVQLCERSKRFGRIKDRDMGRWIGAVELFLVLAACTLHAARAGHYADFYPINGTFQNFNPVRGLLNGQVPCRDFQDYLGLGHLYTGSLCTALLGGDYQASLVAFSFLTIVSLVLTLTVIGGGNSPKENRCTSTIQSVPAHIAYPPITFFKGARSDGDDCLICGRRFGDRQFRQIY